MVFGSHTKFLGGNPGLYLGVNSGGAQRAIHSVGDQNWVGHMPSKCLNICNISLVLYLYTFKTGL